MISKKVPGRPAIVDTVVKLGGGILAYAELFEASLAAIARAASHCRILVVPGGGWFADAVRKADRELRLSDDAAHWMAILAMDQYAYLVVSRLTGGILVERPTELAFGSTIGGPPRIPVLAPSRWLREADPLPHAWTVTSDSIAAWVAGEVGARRLVLIKPPGAGGANILAAVDAYFPQALPVDVEPLVVAADERSALESALSGQI